MLISKPSFTTFADEVVSTVYFIGITTEKYPYVNVYAVLSGFNKDDRPVQYKTLIGSTTSGAPNMKDLFKKRGEVMDDMTKKLELQKLYTLPGIVGTEAVVGEDYKIEKETSDATA